MKRRHFLQSSIGAAVAASLPTSKALAAALAAISEVNSDVNAVTGSGAQVTLEEAAVKELFRLNGDCDSPQPNPDGSDGEDR